MIHAYPEIYLSRAQGVLGDAFDYAINDCRVSGSDFVRLLTVSTTGRRMENGEPDCLTGKSGIEIAMAILEETTGKTPEFVPKERFCRSKEYWIGWAVAYYQWTSGRRYSEIFKAVSFQDLLDLYPTLHEADVSKFADVVDARVRDCFPDTNLKRLRRTYGCTQADLSRRSGVTLRSIQMYEQRNKDINKASAETVLRLSKALGCSMEDLLEK